MAQRYSIPSIALHWTMALAIGLAWVLGQVMEELPRAARATPLGVHMLLGLLVVALLLPRLLARLLGPTPEDTAPAWEKRLAKAAHLLLYVLMLAVPLSGLAISLSARAPTSVLGLFTLPVPLAGSGLHKPLEGVHEVLTNLLLAAVVLHVAATLWHALIRRDNVAARMLPR